MATNQRGFAGQAARALKRFDEMRAAGRLKCQMAKSESRPVRERLNNADRRNGRMTIRVAS